MRQYGHSLLLKHESKLCTPQAVMSEWRLLSTEWDAQHLLPIYSNYCDLCRRRSRVNIGDNKSVANSVQLTAGLWTWGHKVAVSVRCSLRYCSFCSSAVNISINYAQTLYRHGHQSPLGWYNTHYYSDQSCCICNVRGIVRCSTLSVIETGTGEQHIFINPFVKSLNYYGEAMCMWIEFIQCCIKNYLPYS